ncbi:MAG: flagellar hook-length control protein FliK [Planctomycetota bacterium]|nr:flagellar hook-length control protein FliK [Planctomycetota bacterium]
MEQAVVNGLSLKGVSRLWPGMVGQGSAQVTGAFGQVFTDLLNAGKLEKSRMKIGDTRSETKGLADSRMEPSPEGPERNAAVAKPAAESAEDPATEPTTSQSNSSASGAATEKETIDNRTSGPGQTRTEQQEGNSETTDGSQQTQNPDNVGNLVGSEETLDESPADVLAPELLVPVIGDSGNQPAPVVPVETAADATSAPVVAQEALVGADAENAPVLPTEPTGDGAAARQVAKEQQPIVPAPQPMPDSMELGERQLPPQLLRSSEEALKSAQAPLDAPAAQVSVTPGAGIADTAARLQVASVRPQQANAQAAAQTATALDQAAQAGQDTKAQGAQTAQPQVQASSLAGAGQAGLKDQTATVGFSIREESGVVQSISATGGNSKALQVDQGAAGSPAVAGANQAEMIEKIATAMKAAARSGQQKLRMDLHPPNLGGLRIDLVLKDGVLSVAMRTETQAARSMILGNADQLKESLERNDVHVGNFNVTTGGESGQSFANRFELNHPQDNVYGAPTWFDERRRDAAASAETAGHRRASLRMQLVDLVA